MRSRWHGQAGFHTNYGLMAWLGACLVAYGLVFGTLHALGGHWARLLVPAIALLVGLALFAAGEGFSRIADAARWLGRLVCRR